VSIHLEKWILIESHIPHGFGLDNNIEVIYNKLDETQNPVIERLFNESE